MATENAPRNHFDQIQEGYRKNFLTTQKLHKEGTPIIRAAILWLGIRGFHTATLPASTKNHMKHQPVLLEEVIELLRPQKGQVVVDGTFGLGGHAQAIATLIGRGGKLIGIERDKRTLKMVEDITKELPQIKLIHGNFADIEKILSSIGINKADSVLLDLGISSEQLDAAEYGLSWQVSAPLDMRLEGESETALELLRRLSEKELADLLYQNADEYRSRKIARAIKENIAAIKTTKDLAEVVARAIGGRGRIHPATKTFQALRVAVNHEQENLMSFLESAPKVIKPGRRLAIISFHSGEDRIVKQEFKKDIWEMLTKKPIVSSPAEISRNPRARSAKLRVGVRK